MTTTTTRGRFAAYCADGAMSDFGVWITRNGEEGRRSILPFRSRAQAKFMFANKPKIAREFAAATPSIKSLPKKVKAKPKGK